MVKKAWLTPEQQVEHLKSKGVTFDLWSEEDAADYLRDKTSYFRLRSYRANFQKREGGAMNGRYIGLDFAMLVDLSVIDMCLRNELLPLTLDIEHFAKIGLLSTIERREKEGYEIVQDFLSSFPKKSDSRNPVIEEINRGINSPYTGGLIRHHPNADYPVWEFLEVIPFGRLLGFQSFCAKRFGDKNLRESFYLLQSVKGARNACAHNTCILNDMKSGGSPHQVQQAVTKGLGQIGIGAAARKTKMSNERFQQIATTLYMHQRMASEGVTTHRSIRLDELLDRMEKHDDYYPEGSLVSTGLAFLKAMIVGWFPVGRKMD